MSVASSVGNFDLNDVVLRKPLKFPDDTIQETAYTGNAGVPTITEVLTSGNNAGGLDVTNVDNVSLTSITFANATTQSTAYTGVPTITQVLTSGNNAGGLDVTNVDNVSLTSITFANATTQSTAYTGVPTLSEVLGSGSNGNNTAITNLGVMTYQNNGVVAAANKVAGAAATTVPQFEILTVQVQGNAGAVSGTMTLTGNTAGTNRYSVFPSIYYGFTGSAGTYNAQETSSAIKQIVITNITATDFGYIFEKNTGNNVNVYINFLVMYNVSGTNYPKTYS
jgi:hypothetical protein